MAFSENRVPLNLIHCSRTDPYWRFLKRGWLPTSHSCGFFGFSMKYHLQYVGWNMAIYSWFFHWKWRFFIVIGMCPLVNVYITNCKDPAVSMGTSTIPTGPWLQVRLNCESLPEGISINILVLSHYPLYKTIRKTIVNPLNLHEFTIEATPSSLRVSSHFPWKITTNLYEITIKSLSITINSYEITIKSLSITMNPMKSL